MIRIMNKHIFIGFLLLSATYIRAQQMPIYTQLTATRYVVNPAQIGMDDDINVFSGLRRQWWGLGNEPKTLIIGINGRINSVEKEVHAPLALRTSRPDQFHLENNEVAQTKIISHGVGVHLVSDNFGAFASSSIVASYAVRKEFSSNVRLSIGANTSYNRIRFNDQLAIPETTNDNVYQSYLSANMKSSSIDFNLGVNLEIYSFEIGYASGQLLGDKISLNSNNYQFLRTHHSLIGSYEWETTKELKLQPIIYFRTVGSVPSSIDLSLMATYKDLYFMSFGIRNRDAFMIMFGAEFSNRFIVSYSIDSSLNSIRKYNSGGHEINVIFKI